MVDSILLDTAGAAGRLGISRSTLEKMRVYGGGAPYIKIGTSVRYRIEDLDRWVESRLTHSTSDANIAVPSHPSRARRLAKESN